MGVALSLSGYLNSQQAIKVTATRSVTRSLTTTSMSYIGPITSSYSNAVLLSDHYTLAGIAGTNYGCEIDYSHTDQSIPLGAAQTIEITVTATKSVNFWVFTDKEYASWKSASYCSTMLEAPSIVTRTHITQYSGFVQVPYTANYHIAFDNDNQSPASVTVTVTGPLQITESIPSPVTETLSSQSYESTVETRRVGFGPIFYLGVVSVGVGLVLLFFASRADYTHVYE
jgi:hypothetical protein